MKIYRGKNQLLTDEIEIPDNWLPCSKIEVDATIDKDGQRHTAIAIEITADDVAKLVGTAFEWVIDERNRLRKKYKNAMKQTN